MPDIVDAKTRSGMMSGIGGKNTKPAIIVRKTADVIEALEKWLQGQGSEYEIRGIAA